MSASFRLETSRLILRRFQGSDLEDLLAYRNDPDVARHQSWTSFSREEAEGKGAWGSEFLYAVLEREWRGRA